jgi:hypothetical protein
MRKQVVCGECLRHAEEQIVYLIDTAADVILCPVHHISEAIPLEDALKSEL